MKKKKKIAPSSNNYETLKALSKKARLLRGACELLSWDQETYMPEGASSPRSEQLELISGLAHEAKTSPVFTKALESCIDLKKGTVKISPLSSKKKAALREWRRDYLLQSRLPTSFVEEFSKLTSQAQEAWKKARSENDFSLFLPFLEKIVIMNRKKADLYGYKDHPYDALLDEYEPDLTVKTIAPLFAEVKKGLAPFIKNPKKPGSLLNLEIPESIQLALAKTLLEKVGYDFHYGRLDLSVHPFSTAFHPKDSRITTRLSAKNPFSNILTCLHEAGHALYEMGLPESEYGTPLCEPISLGIHESQSRFWETRIGLSLPFWKGFLPLMQREIPQLQKISPMQLFSAINPIHPSFIRTEADEVTYPFHVILRYEIEKGLMEGSLKVKEIPSLWNQKMQESLGITPTTDREGCLQDVHWSMGAIGYFPTYLLGTLYASQFFLAFTKAEPHWEKRVEKLDLHFIKKWLNTHIHASGREFSAQDLIKKVSGQPFSAGPFLRYIGEKFSTEKNPSPKRSSR